MQFGNRFAGSGGLGMPTRREMILSTAASVLPVDIKIEPVDEPVALLVKFPKNSSTRQIEYLSQQAKRSRID